MQRKGIIEVEEKIGRLKKDLRRCEEKIQILNREKEVLESLIRHSFLGIVTVDRDMNVVSCNREFERLFRFEESEITGQNLDHLIGGVSNLDEARRYSEETLQGGTTHGIGTRFRKDEKPVTVEFFAVPAISDGKVVGAYGLYQDITEREEIAEALRESEERYRRLVDLSPIGISVCDLTGKILFANRAAMEIFGTKSPDGIKGKSIFDLIHPESMGLVKKGVKALMSRGPQPKIEEKVKTFDGRNIYIEITSMPIPYRGNASILVVFQDVTERVNASMMLQESESKLKRVFQASPLGIGLVKDRIMQWHNEAMSKILGYAPDELVGKNSRFIYPNDEEYEKAGRCLASLGSEKRIADVEAKWVRKDGRIIDCHIWYSFLDRMSDDHTILAIAEDITERKRMEGLLQESEARYRQLVELSPLPITVYDEHNLYFGNTALFKILKAKSKEDFLGKHPEDFISPNYRPMARERIKRFLKGELLPSVHEELVTLEGEIIEVEAYSVPVTHQGKPAIMSVFLDVTETVKAEKRLKEEQEKYRCLYEESKRQEELYRSLLNSSADAIVIYNLKGEVEFLSPSFTRTFGWTFEELEGSQIPFVPEEERKATFSVIETLIEKGEPVHEFETHRLTKDGRILDISISASRFNDIEGKPAGILVVLRDITKRKETERRLKEEEKRYRELYNESKRQEELYRSLLNSSADAIVIYNLRGEAEYVSPSFTRTFGWSFDEVEGNQIPFVPKSEKESTQAVIKKLFSTREPIHGFETRRLTKDGRLLNVSVSGSLFMDASGDPVGVLVVLRDITERVKAEKIIRESEKRFRDLYDSVFDLIYTQDLEGRFLSVNRAVVELFGYAPEEIIGHRGSEFMKPELRPFYDSIHLRSIKKKGFHKGISVYFTKDGRKVYLENSSVLSRQENGSSYISGIARDVTDWIIAQRKIKKLQEDMLQAQKMEAIGTLAGGIAHDFNNLLMGIQGNVSLLKFHVHPDSPEYERLRSIEEYIQNGSDLTTQLLGFARGGALRG